VVAAAAATAAVVAAAVAAIAVDAAEADAAAIEAIEAIAAIAGSQQNSVEFLRGLRALSSRARSPFSLSPDRTTKFTASQNFSWISRDVACTIPANSLRAVSRRRSQPGFPRFGAMRFLAPAVETFRGLTCLIQQARKLSPASWLALYQEVLAPVYRRKTEDWARNPEPP